jgi:antitoxin HicB
LQWFNRKGPATTLPLTLAVWKRDTSSMTLRFRVLIEEDEDGIFVAECPNLPGCVSQGATREEALANIRDAMEGYLASLEKHGEPVPPPIQEEFVELNLQ